MSCSCFCSPFFQTLPQHGGLHLLWSAQPKRLKSSRRTQSQLLSRGLGVRRRFANGRSIISTLTTLLLVIDSVDDIWGQEWIRFSYSFLSAIQGLKRNTNAPTLGSRASQWGAGTLTGMTSTASGWTSPTSSLGIICSRWAAVHMMCMWTYLVAFLAICYDSQMISGAVKKHRYISVDGPEPPSFEFLQIVINPNYEVAESDYTNNIVKCRTRYDGHRIWMYNCHIGEIRIKKLWSIWAGCKFYCSLVLILTNCVYKYVNKYTQSRYTSTCSI